LGEDEDALAVALEGISLSEVGGSAAPLEDEPVAAFADFADDALTAPRYFCHLLVPEVLDQFV
jgi:hypothetical protein